MSDIFEKNLEFIKEYNPSLAQKLVAIQEYSRAYDINTNLAGEYNLLVDGTPVHSLTGAQQEAQEIFETLTHNSANSLHIIYGMGLGYLYDTFSQNSHGNIVVYEPDIEALRFVLEIVDFSIEFSKKKTYIVSDNEELFQAFQTFYRYKTKVSFSTDDYHINANQNTYNAVAAEVKQLNLVFGHNFSFQMQEIYNFWKATMQGIDKKLKFPILNDSADALKDKPALIVSAGPSLAQNIEFIKKHKDNFVIFCVGTALKTLLNNGIKPDFLNIIEKVDTKVHYNFPETKDMMLICEPYTNGRVLEQEYKQVFITGSEETETARWFLEKRERPDAFFETKGTVAYHAIYSAYTLGCNPIVLIGQDLAYSNGECYTKGSCFENLKCKFDKSLNKYIIEPDNNEKFRDAYFHNKELSTEKKNELLKLALAEFNDKLKTVPGQNGESLPTSKAYALFISYISSFAQRYGEKVKLINCSKGGAQIDGFENLDMEQAFTRYAAEKLNKEVLFAAMNTKSIKNPTPTVNSLKKDIQRIKKMLKHMRAGKDDTAKLKKELEIRKCKTEKAQLYLENAVNLFIELSSEYLSKCKILAIPGAFHIGELSYLIKEYQTQNDYEMYLKLYKYLDKFYNIYYGRLVKVKEELCKLTVTLEG